VGYYPSIGVANEDYAIFVINLSVLMSDGSKKGGAFSPVGLEV